MTVREFAGVRRALATLVAVTSCVACTTHGSKQPPVAAESADAGREQAQGSATAAQPDAQTEAAQPCVEPETGVPDDVFCTGLYKNRDATQYESAPKPYTPGVLLWSDGADKRRYLSLPPGTQIDTSDMDVWKFPVGTKVWKEFRFDGKLVETRLLWKRGPSMWATGTYIWTSDQKSAPLNTSRQPVLLDTGYEIPTAKDCGRCHHGGADYLLGVEAVALGLPTAKGLTLTGLVESGALTDPPATTTIELPEDATGKAATALGYLHANCGMPCHSSRGLGHDTELVMRLRADEFWPTPQPVANLDAYKATINVSPTTKSVEQKFPDTHRITPGNHEQSLVWLLSHLRGEYQMPPIVSHKIDEIGTKALGDWIDALPH